MKRNLILIIEIVLAGWLMIQPVNTGNSQDVPPKQQPSIEALKQEGETLNEQIDKEKEDFIKAASEQASEKSNRKVEKPRTRVKEVLASDKQILLRVDGKTFYKPKAELYRDYVIIDIKLDSLIRDREIEKSLVDLPVCVDTPVSQTVITSDSRTNLQKAIDFIQFWKKKNKQSK